MTRKNDAKFEEELIWGIWKILTRALESLKNLHFNGLLLDKIYNVWAKKGQKSYVWLHWKLMQNLKVIDLCFPKWHEEFGKFSQAEK